MKTLPKFSALQFILRFDVSFFDFLQQDLYNDARAQKILKLVSLENIVIGSVLVQNEGICKGFKRSIVHGSDFLMKRRKPNFCAVSENHLTFSDLNMPSLTAAKINPIFSTIPSFRNRQFSDKAESESDCPSSLDVESGTQCNCLSSLNGEQCAKSQVKENLLDSQCDVSFSRLNVESESLSSSDDTDSKNQEIGCHRSETSCTSQILPNDHSGNP